MKNYGFYLPSERQYIIDLVLTLLKQGQNVTIFNIPSPWQTSILTDIRIEEVEEILCENNNS